MDFRENTALSPESEDGFGMDLDPSPGRRGSTSSSEGEDDFGMAMSPSPEVQDDPGVDPDLSGSQGNVGREGSCSPQSQYSFGMGSSDDEEDVVRAAVLFSTMHGQGTQPFLPQLEEPLLQ
jgi:hypothetical protein